MQPINIITRCSRKEGIVNTLNSLNSQKISNVNHFITYENNEMYAFLKGLKYKYNTEFIKVPKYNKVDNLYMSYEHDDYYSNYLEPDYEFMNIKFHYGKNIDKDHGERKKLEPVKFEKDGFWCMTLDKTIRLTSKHFPYNLYLKIAEQKIDNGWIFFLDDDDVFYDNDSLLELNENILNNCEDTMFIFKMLRKPTTVPSDDFFKRMKIGLPLVFGEIGASTICFHSKYKKYTVWDEWANSDYRTAKSLERVIKNKKFINKIFVNALNAGKGI